MPPRLLPSSAFTLIELVLVISIMGIATSFVAANFWGARIQQQLALLADKSVAMLQVAEKEVRSGVYDPVDGAYYCKGAHFVEGEEPVSIAVPYDVENAVCDFSRTVLEESFGLLTSPAVVGNITIEGMEGVEGLYALYVPPQANLVFYDESGAGLFGSSEVTFTAGLDRHFPFSLRLSTVTGLAVLSPQSES